MTESTALQGRNFTDKPNEADKLNEIRPATGSEATWQKVAQECWASNDLSKCSAPDATKMQIGGATSLDNRFGTAGRVALPGLIIVGETGDGDGKTKPASESGGGDAKVKPAAEAGSDAKAKPAAVNDDKLSKQQADAQTLMDGKATPEARLKAANNLVEAKIDSIQVQGADGKAYSIRLETIQVGNSKEMVHAFLRTEDGKESTALRGILKGDGTVEQERNKKGAFVAYEGRAGAKLDSIEASKIEFNASTKRLPEEDRGKSSPADETQPKKKVTPERQPDASKVMPPHDHSHTKPKTNELPQGDGAIIPGKRTAHGAVDDRRVLAQVPDAQQIGQSGRVTSMSNRNGEVKPYWLAADAASALEAAQRLLAPKGKQVIIDGKNGAGRTIDTQTEIYTRSHGGRSFAAGAPTKSNHVRGHALDISNYQDPDVFRALKAVGFRQGDSRGPIKGDEHHFSFAGKRRS